MNKLASGLPYHLKVLWPLVCFALGACNTATRIPADGTFYGTSVRTTVDSDFARHYLEGFRHRQEKNQNIDQEIVDLHNNFGAALPTREDLQSISRHYSTDFAALFLADRILRDECNRALNQSFADYIGKGKTRVAEQASQYTILFVPGWDYADNGHVTGADFAQPRALAWANHLENYLVALPPTGSVEDNAVFLATTIARQARLGKKLIIAGASSAAPAIHLALGELVSHRDRKTVAAWLNLGGILQGSPLIDIMQRWPQRWLFNIVAWLKGWNINTILSMSTAVSRKRFAQLQLPPGILVINYVGIPLSGQLSRYSKDKYPLLKAQGPNDGMTLISDAIMPGGLSIVALGSDHFFAEDPDIDLKTIALMNLLVTHINSERCRGSKQ